MAHDGRLYDVGGHDLDAAENEQHDEERGQMVELDQREQRRRHDGQDRAHGGDVIEEEHQHRPEAGEIDADPGHDEIGKRCGRCRERGLDADVAADLAVDPFQHGADAGLVLASPKMIASLRLK